MGLGWESDYSQIALDFAHFSQDEALVDVL